jgi:hypothetical protein
MLWKKKIEAIRLLARLGDDNDTVNHLCHKSYFQLRNDWAMLYNDMAQLVAEMEIELQVMKEKKLPQPVIAKKDRQIQTIVDFYNHTEILLQHYDETLQDLSISRNMHERNDDMTTQILIKNLQYIAKHFKKLSDGSKS